ncbi:MAG: hypothetical protein JHC88_05145, partial [Niveispirillum sp.]|nr:hypothetical protein [Niveispirillum sp.]
MSPRPAEAARFRYKALRADGTREAGAVQAANEKAALDMLRARGLSPLTLSPDRRAAASWRGLFRPPALT